MTESGNLRCGWCGSDPLYIQYHDEEWGRPVDDDIRLFEKICLEGFQSGLSWITILRKRENFRAAFDGFDYNKVASYTARDVDRLLSNEGIIRHRGKIESTIKNASNAIALKEEYGSLGAYFWSWEPPMEHRPVQFTAETLKTLTTTPNAVALSKDLKKRGWSFIGPTTIYAFMQAMGIVNDHVEHCHCRAMVDEARRKFKKPI
jgi:DNA-3-methyladenine glycosylase I